MVHPVEAAVGTAEGLILGWCVEPTVGSCEGVSAERTVFSLRFDAVVVSVCRWVGKPRSIVGSR